MGCAGHDIVRIRRVGTKAVREARAVSAGVLSLAAGAGGHGDGRAEAADIARKGGYAK
jgi:hypothetical protein